MNQPLLTTLRQLRLSGLGKSIEVRLQEAAANRLTHLEFLELILQDELSVRHQRQLDQRLRLAEFSVNPPLHRAQRTQPPV